MKVDARTLEELEILASTGGGPGALELSPGPVTVGGRDRLRDLLTASRGDPAEILARQRSLTFVARDAAPRRLQADPELVAAVRAYRSNRFETLRRRGFAAERLEALWTGLRYSDLLASARAGSRRVAALLEWLDAVCVHLRSRDPPASFGARIGAMEEAMGEAPLPEVRSRAGGLVSWHRRLRWDRALRRRRHSPLDPVLKGVFELDALVTLAEATVARDGWSLPSVLEEAPPRVEARKLRHPALREAVANDVSLGGEGRVLVLTGPNMAGKTTYLKACGIAVLLAVVATHLGDSAARLGDRDGVALARIEAERDGESIRFPHRLRPGVTDQRLGLDVLEREGFFELLEGIGPSGSSPGKT